MEGFKVVCAWCKGRISGPDNALRTSHGICRLCLDRVRSEALAQHRTEQVQQQLKGIDLGGEG